MAFWHPDDMGLGFGLRGGSSENAFSWKIDGRSRIQFDSQLNQQL